MNDQISQALRSLFLFKKAVPLSKKEEFLISENELIGVLYQRITSTKFRKSQVDKETEDFTRKYLKRAVLSHEPIRLYFLFGGYKQARLTSFPYPEWAEIFTLSFALETASYLESIYDPGVEVIYRTDEVVMPILSNYKELDCQKYSKRFSEYIQIFNNIIPKERRISLDLEFTRNAYDKNELFSLMEELYPSYLSKFETLPFDEQERRIQKSYRNQCWHGEEDLTGLSEREKKEHSKKSYILHDAFLMADFKLAEDFFENGVSIAYRKGCPLALHYGACSSCSVQFWAGEGFLKYQGDRYIPWILSYEQQKDLNFSKVKVENKDFDKLGLNEIRIFEKSYN